IETFRLFTRSIVGISPLQRCCEILPERGLLSLISQRLHRPQPIHNIFRFAECCIYLTRQTATQIHCTRAMFVSLQPQHGC
ncbi:hypothetical protein ALC53_00821, partial [Atta colombica]